MNPLTIARIVGLAVSVLAIASAGWTTCYYLKVIPMQRDHAEEVAANQSVEIATMQGWMDEQGQQAETKRKAGEQHAKDNTTLIGLRGQLDRLLRPSAGTICGAAPSANGSDSTADLRNRAFYESLDRIQADEDRRNGRIVEECDNLNLEARQHNAESGLAP